MAGPFVDKLFNYFYKERLEFDFIFFDWIRESINEESVVLKIGAGAGNNWPYDFAKIAKKVVGIDMDPRVADNPNLTDSICADFYENNIEDNSFDIVFANNVVEHIEFPLDFIFEVKRILKPNGCLFFKTPNLYHYVPLIAKITPFWFHKFYCRLQGREIEDVFPTYYHMNTYRAIEKLSKIADFNYELRTIEAQPDYLFFEPATFLMGVCYERLVNRYDLLKNLRIVMMAKIKFNK